MELNLGTGPARLLDAEDLTSFAVVLEGDGDPSPEALAAGGILGLGDHAWVRTDALRRLAGTIATPEWEGAFAAMLQYARSRGWVDDELGAVRGHVERRTAAPITPVAGGDTA
ncbi:MAG TPA: hypothetical protein VFY32_05635 [Solirubrobacteraceae bacterium]|nr:hypothetical protein [Solirubrobacteraceae bacterium]